MLVGAGLSTVALLSLSGTTPPMRAHLRPISELSRSLQQQAALLVSEGQFSEAVGYYESSITADPRNVPSYLGLADLAQRQDLPGQAVRYYRAALSVDPNNRTALAGQGKALIARGALERARDNYARLQQLCSPGGCAEMSALSSALNGAGQRTALAAEEVLPKPVVEPSPQQR